MSWVPIVLSVGKTGQEIVFPIVMKPKIKEYSILPQIRISL